MIKKIKVCILRSDGTNCDEELSYAFEKTGCETNFIHINEFRSKQKKLIDYNILALPGGFSYGDNLASGKVLAVELISFFKEQLNEYIEKKGYILGICNGFQTLVRTGLLPFTDFSSMSTTLTHNASGHFECRYVKIKTYKSNASYLDDLDYIMDVAINHGEGKFFTDPITLERIRKQNHIVFKYVDSKGNPTDSYPSNPNGSILSIAGLTNQTGRILGLMPHPEKFIDITQHPNWRAEDFKFPHGFPFFQKIVYFVKNS